MGMNRRSFSLFLGTPPCLQHTRRRQAQPTSELTVLQLTQLIRILRQLPDQSPVEEPQDGGPSVTSATDASRSCHSKSFRSRCWLCIHNHHKHAT
ncbi:unnamed protein product [Staurois parvus]|uniref:Uncharacterized protein n=1 Tax=Staurois parvus TaxID=386267 RepID=A0ABN9F9U4_9NEOB|nr:unnamed protein product [Staurois parvus]